MEIKVEQLIFDFPGSWYAMKFDDSNYYRRQFGRMWQRISSVDLVAVSNDGIAFFIEVKDYRLARESGPSELPEIVAHKVFDTLAAQIPCKLHATEEDERLICKKVCLASDLIVVLHLEQPQTRVGIFRPYDRALIQQKLRQLLKPVHARPWVLCMDSMGNAPWSVSPV